MIFPSIAAVLRVTPFAIFGGRGGRNQHSTFHQAFLDEKDRLRPQYVSSKTNAEKRLLQEELILWVLHQGGEFFKCNHNGTYEVMTQPEKIQKSSQALREARKQRRHIPPSMTFVPETISVASHCIDISMISNTEDNVFTVTNDSSSSCSTFTMEIDDISLHSFSLDHYCDVLKNGRWNEMRKPPTVVTQDVPPIDNDNDSIVSDTTVDSFDIVMQMLDQILKEVNDLEEDDDVNEPIVIDFNNIVPI